MNSKSIAAITVVAAAALAPLVTQSQQPARTDQKRPITKEADPTVKGAGPRTKEITALQATAQAFIEAFNRGDAQAVAALWTKDGEYVNESGQRFEGRDAIEKEYSSFFAAHPGAKVNVVIDSLRIASDTTAIEDGRTLVELGPIRSGDYARYTAVHVKAEGKWLMSSVRDARVESSSPSSQLHDLQWLVGSWTAEEGGVKMEVVCRWIAGNTFLERSYTVKRGDQVATSGVQVIGWNPQAGSIQSWNFTSDGGHAVGLWSPHPNGWAIETSGMMADGTPTRSVNVFMRLDDNAASWKSVERSVGGIPLPETEEVLLNRVASRR